MRYSTKLLLAGLALFWNVYPAQVCNAEALEANRGSADVMEVDDLGQAMAPGDLGLQNGRQNITIEEVPIQLNNSSQNGIMDGNILTSNLTGANSVDASAFSNMNGIATIIQNSGNQVLIQNSTIVNVMMK